MEAEKLATVNVTMRGRGYPTAARAVAVLRDKLAADGIEPLEIRARRWTDKDTFCPWEAVATISRADANKILTE